MTALGVVHAVVTIALLVLVLQTLLNLACLPRLGRQPAPATPACAAAADPAPPARVAVLVPARNEVTRIAACVRAWAAQDHPDYEVVVYDDDSSDDTAALAAAASPRVRVVRGGALPHGWRGKPHACHRLRHETDAPILVFADADVTPAPAALARVTGAMDVLGADALSALPRHTSAHHAVRMLVGLQNWAALALVPHWLRGQRPMFAVLNGQFLAIRSTAYDATGGFAAVAGSLGEDTALGRRLAAHDFRVVLVDGTDLLHSHPYGSLGDLWAAHVRNLIAVFFGSPALLLGAVAALAALYAVPTVVLAAGLAGGRWGNGAWTWWPLGELGLAVLPRSLSDARAGYGPWGAMLHPLAGLALLAMAVTAAWRLARGGTVDWRGRRYRLTGPD